MKSVATVVFLTTKVYRAALLYTRIIFYIFHQLYDLSGPKCEGADSTIAQKLFWGEGALNPDDASFET